MVGVAGNVVAVAVGDGKGIAPRVVGVAGVDVARVVQIGSTIASIPFL